ncbi:MAG: ribonuclease P protein component [Thermoleophilia bacterium]
MLTPDGATRGRRGRLTRSRDFDAVYRRGRSTSDRHLVVYLFARDADAAADAPRLGLSVSRKVGGAVERNRVKRVLREQFATMAHLVPADTDVVVIARRGIHEFLEERGSAALGLRLEAVLTRGLGERAVAERSA